MVPDPGSPVPVVPPSADASGTAPGSWGATIERTGWARIAAKSVVEACAHWLGRDDGDTARVSREYSQRVTRETEEVYVSGKLVRQSVNRVRIVVRTPETPWCRARRVATPDPRPAAPWYR